jgi:hypothetical protein
MPGRSLLLLAVLLAPSAALAQSGEPTVRPDVARLLEVTGAARAEDQITDAVIEGLRRAHPDVADQEWASLRQDLGTEKLTGRLAAIYERSFTAEEIEALLAFYESPIGQKTLEVMPSVAREQMEAQRDFHRALLDRARQRLAEEGHKPRSMPRPGAEE